MRGGLKKYCYINNKKGYILFYGRNMSNKPSDNIKYLINKIKIIKYE